eukprot:TRINITY_DN1148_c0_g1_i1.p1 TRINITY_DN1148_c0_g1~~TRINITY_DN1148_c0_g1_i1.p1  ORF type:complete len:115 (-),score=11.91 TRINITY_DN1148_c0_g1_i1:247-591(-)
MSENENSIRSSNHFWNMKPNVIPYDPQWPKLYEEEKKLLTEELSSICINIEHFGSTSVPGMKAKPIIDIQIAVKLEDMPLNQYILSKLKAFGYIVNNLARTSIIIYDLIKETLL